jgi:hypothetical protein
MLAVLGISDFSVTPHHSAVVYGQVNLLLHDFLIAEPSERRKDNARFDQRYVPSVSSLSGRGSARCLEQHTRSATAQQSDEASLYLPHMAEHAVDAAPFGR